MSITSVELRKIFLEFFKEKGHVIVESASLVPENDPTVLFNTAGMQPLVPYLLGEPHPMGNRLADAQKCVRTTDIDEVGDDSHLTFFEMLGNWSLGDYFKEDSIRWSYEFLVDKKWLGLDPKYLAVTVFQGDENAPRDDASARIWSSLGVPKNRISFMPAKNNWWAAGPTGPCGPDTEIFYWIGTGDPNHESNVLSNESLWMEIWNNVFMEFNKLADGRLVNLPKQNVDTGMGLERTVAILNGYRSVYQTDAFSDVLDYIKSVIGTNNYVERSARIIADHIRAAVHIISDGIVPRNVDQGYVLRRLIRRASREFYKMGYTRPVLSSMANCFIEKFKGTYSSVMRNDKKVLEEISKEEERFSKTLKEGIKEFERVVSKLPAKSETSGNCTIQIPGEDAFHLYDTFGFPLEMTIELAKERRLFVDEKGFWNAFGRHQELSREGSEGKFKGGLAGTGERETRYHTATHLLLAALRKVLGDHVHQAGSNITSERLRFDFSHPQKLSAEEKVHVEEFVNQVIQSRASVKMVLLAKAEAKAKGIEGSFWDKYPDMVKIYTISAPDGTLYSEELCGGPHLESTAEMGHFKIIKEEASSAGIRRIKAVLE